MHTKVHDRDSAQLLTSSRFFYRKTRRAMKPMPKLGIFEILLLGAICLVVVARLAGSVPFNTFIILLLVLALILAIRLWRR